jgi:hypothetical protein
MDYGRWMVRMLQICRLGGRWLVASGLNLLIAVLGRKNEQVFCVLFENKLGIFDFFVSLAPDHAIGDDEHDPDHPQENANTASWIINIRERD